METRFKTLQIVWAAMMAGVFLYALVTYALIALGSITLDALPRRVLTLVAPVAVVGMIAGTVLRRRLIDAIPASLAPEQRLERYSVASITGLALIEGCGLLIITLALAAGAATWAILGGGLAIGTMGVSGPKRDEAGLGR